MVDRTTVLLLCIWLAIQSAAAWACPFCAKLGKTLSDEAAQAEFVAAGLLKNPRIEGETDYEITDLIKGDEKGPRTVTLAKYLAVARNEPVARVIFGDIVEKRVDPFRIMVIRSDSFVPYLRGAVAHYNAKPAEKFAYFSQYLEHSDQNIALDAYQEFAKAPYVEVAAAAASYDADRLLELIRNPLTPGDRIGLYGLMVGVAGGAEDAKALRSLVENPDQRRINGIDGLLGGLCVLDPPQGLELSLDILSDSKASFNLRYAALEAVRFALLELQSFDREQVYERLQAALTIPELSDLIIDELRKYEQWQSLDRVLDLAKSPEYDIAVVRRAVLRFAIECPQPAARNYVEKVTKLDPHFVSDVRSSLKFEKQLQQQFGGPKSNSQK